MSEIHRLKLAFIFVFIYFLTNKNKFLFVILSILSHLEITIIYIYESIINYMKKKHKYNSKIFLLLIFICCIFVFFKNDVLYKLQYYWRGDLQIKTLLIGFGYIIYLSIFEDKKYFKYFFPLFLIILLLSYAVGGGRLNFYLIEYMLIFESIKFFKYNKIYAAIILLPLILWNIYKIIHYLKITGQI